MRFVRRLMLVSLVGLSLPVAVALPHAAAEESPRRATSPAYAASPFPALFGTREAYSPDNSAFFKWTGMLERFDAERQRASGPCPADVSEDCEPGEWRQLVRELRGLDLRAKVERVNEAINSHPYIPSMRNWGESNHWETPFEFFRKSGQCQDYAITKYMLLRAAGVPAAQLRLVVLHDTHLGLDHAVTIVYVDGTAYMLDNQFSDVVPAESVHHYQPYYSINEQGWWLHRGSNARYAGAAESAKAN